MVERPLLALRFLNDFFQEIIAILLVFRNVKRNLTRKSRQRIINIILREVLMINCREKSKSKLFPKNIVYTVKSGARAKYS